VFVATLHRYSCRARIAIAGRDGGYDIPRRGIGPASFYRAMAWLGEEMEEKSEEALAPRCVKDVIEERLFDQRRDLFADLSAVFMDTTSLSFYGEGGETFGEHGYSKDYRPDLRQMILALIVDGAGRPICTEMWPGNTADVATLLPVIDRLRHRFSIGRVCVVADRGMISAATIEDSKRASSNIFSARGSGPTRLCERSSSKTRLPSRRARRAQGGETQLFVKQVKIEGKRYIVCRNEAEAEKDRKDREAIVAALDAH